MYAVRRPRPVVARLGPLPWLAVAVSAAGAAVATAAPSASAADPLWRVLAAAMVTMAGIRASRVTWLLPAAVAAACFAAAGEPVGMVVALAVLLGITLLPPARELDHLLGPWAVGVGVQLLLWLPTVGRSNLTSLLGVVAGAVVIVSGWQGARRRERRLLARTGGIVLAAGLVLLLPAAIVGVVAWRDASRGVGAANAWLVNAAHSETDASAGYLTGATSAFDDADSLLARWWVRPVRYLPGAGQHLEAARTGIGGAVRVVDSARTIIDVADVQSLRVDGGAVDLDRVAAVAPPLDDGRTVLAAVRHEIDGVDRQWLLPFVTDKLDVLQGQVVDAQTDADLAAQAVAVAPELLGRDGPKRYFVAFTSPAEVRELGGFMGSWGILTVDHGKLHLERTGRSGDLNSRDEDLGLPEDGTFPVRYLRSQPWRYWQNITAVPDLPTVTAAVADLYPKVSGDAPIDGVLVVDPIALAALLELTGPVKVDGLDQPLTPKNAAAYLLRDQYATFTDLEDRVDVLGDVADTTFEHLTGGSLPGPGRIADVLSPAVRGRHLLFWTTDDAPHALLERLGLDGRLPAVEGGADVLAVARSNSGPNKLDAYLQEDLDYDVEVDASTGAVHSVLRATYTNTAPDGLNDYVAGNDHDLPVGTNRFLLSVYSPYQAQGAKLEPADGTGGTVLPLEHQLELGRHRYLAFVAVPRGTSVTVEVRFEGALDARGYRLAMVLAPQALPPTATVSVHDPGGTPVEAPVVVLGDRSHVRG